MRHAVEFWLALTFRCALQLGRMQLVRYAFELWIAAAGVLPLRLSLKLKLFGTAQFRFCTQAFDLAILRSVTLSLGPPEILVPRPPYLKYTVRRRQYPVGESSYYCMYCSQVSLEISWS
jgi:hypothetical protein